ncbi:ArsR/SmtB family transcription factor [Streptomyces sp. NPDC052396]|uniref:ArsR/SmtB family transcription factor n=1 Tax=Streptomyces sp. NPDC052396 TaxID=3365689 RepID=UPI0037D0C1E1
MRPDATGAAADAARVSGPEGETAVLRIDMDAHTLANTRFAISPLSTTVEALWLLRSDVPASGGGWRALIRETVRDRRLTLLGSLFTGSWDYVPDFVTPHPEVPEARIQDELHAVAAIGSERLGYEIGLMLRGDADERMVGRPLPGPLLDVLQRGESALAERLAAELHQLWQAAIAPHWSALHARMDADINRRAQAIARQGMAAMLGGLHPKVVWQGDHLGLLTRFRGHICDGVTSLVLTPSVFGTELHMIVDGLPGPSRRQPMFLYPAHPGPDSASDPAQPAHALLGVTRARLLTDLRTPRSTVELGERHCLAASTVSYHLGILHRSGLVTRTRTRHRVLYQQTPRAAGLL